MEATELVIFNKNEIAGLIESLGLRTRTIKGKTFVSDNNGVVRCCDSCNRELEVTKVGSIARGSVMIYCDNPLCLSTWVAVNKI